jgi:hypothetical protein
VTDGGLVWIEGSEDIARRVSQLPFEVHQTWASALWVRWSRAEHTLRQMALSDCAKGNWSVSFEGRWLVGSESFPSLLEALESIAKPEERWQPLACRVVTRNSWPVSGTAYTLSANRGLSSGLSFLTSDSEWGFRASYPGGDRHGFSLTEVLS